VPNPDAPRADEPVRGAEVEEEAVVFGAGGADPEVSAAVP